MLTIGTGVVLVPNRKFFLPTRPEFVEVLITQICPCKSPFCNRLHTNGNLSQETLLEMMDRMTGIPDVFRVTPERLIVPPSVARLIETPGTVERQAAERMGFWPPSPQGIRYG
jgi:hypothetical protein